MSSSEYPTGSLTIRRLMKAPVYYHINFSFQGRRLTRASTSGERLFDDPYESQVVYDESQVVYQLGGCRFHEPKPSHLVTHHSPGATTVAFCNFQERIRRLLIAAKNY